MLPYDGFGDKVNLLKCLVCGTKKGLKNTLILNIPILSDYSYKRHYMRVRTWSENIIFPTCDNCSKELQKWHRPYIKARGGLIYVRPKHVKKWVEYLEWIKNILEENLISKTMNDLNNMAQLGLNYSKYAETVTNTNNLRFCENCGREITQNLEGRKCKQCSSPIGFKSKTHENIIELFKRNPKRKLTILSILNQRDKLNIPIDIKKDLNYNRIKDIVESLYKEKYLEREGSEGKYSYSLKNQQ